MADKFPLILLSQQELPDLEALFLELIEKSNEVFLVHRHSKHCLELNFSGARFDCEIFELEDAYSEFKQIMLNSNLAMARSGLALGFSEFASSPQPILPMVKLLLELASILAKSLRVSAVLWKPAELASGPELFQDSVHSFVSGGAFPSLSLVRFESTKIGVLRTRGLTWFADQEIEFHLNQLAENEAVRRMIRIIHDIAENGAIAEDVETAGLDHGERVFLTLHQEEKLVRVKTTSEME